jgi:hypothetical protein
MVKTYVARRRLKMGADLWREPGELVPEAHTWMRIESYLNSGYVRPTEISEDDFRAAVASYCPEESARILELAGVTALLTGPRSTPRPIVEVVVTKPTAKKAARKPAKKATDEDA